MIYTTLNKIRACGPCGLKPDPDGNKHGLCKLMHHLGKKTTDDEPVSLLTVIESNGLEDANWVLRSVPEESARWRRLAVAYARTVQHLITHPASLRALDVAQAHADGRATDRDLAVARDAAWDAAGAVAGDAARDAAWDAAGAVAWDAAWAVAGAVARAVARAAARDAAWAVAGDAAGDAAVTLPRPLHWLLPGPLHGPLPWPLPGTLLGTLPRAKCVPFLYHTLNNCAQPFNKLEN